MTRPQPSPPLRPANDVAVLFRGRYLEMVRLAGLLRADDPEDIAQEAFARKLSSLPPPRSRRGCYLPGRTTPRAAERSGWAG